MTSILMKSPQPISRDKWAMRTASSAVRALDVFGSRVTFFGIYNRGCYLSDRLRRGAGPWLRSGHRPCSTAASMRSTENLPEPKMKRDVNSWPPRTRIFFFHWENTPFMMIDRSVCFAWSAGISPRRRSGRFP